MKTGLEKNNSLKKGIFELYFCFSRVLSRFRITSREEIELNFTIQSSRLLYYFYKYGLMRTIYANKIKKIIKYIDPLKNG
jgi:hypothetical protein